MPAGDESPRDTGRGIPLDETPPSPNAILGSYIVGVLAGLAAGYRQPSNPAQQRSTTCYFPTSFGHFGRPSAMEDWV